MKELKLVIDANILVSAYSSNGRIREAWRDGLGTHQLVISPEIFAEVERNLRQAQFHLSHDQIQVCLRDILERCDLIRPRAKYTGTISDEKDRHLINVGLEVHADIIITGESSLLREKEIAGIRISRFHDFVQDRSKTEILHQKSG